MSVGGRIRDGFRVAMSTRAESLEVSERTELSGFGTDALIQKQDHNY